MRNDICHKMLFTSFKSRYIFKMIILDDPEAGDAIGSGWKNPGTGLFGTRVTVLII